MENRVFSPLDLLLYNGEDAPQIYISFLGTVFDVSSRPDLYGQSPPGPYHLFAGRECARSLATMSMDPKDVGRTDLEDLATLTEKLSAAMSPSEVRAAVSKAMCEWKEKLFTSYETVGVLRPWLSGRLQPLPSSCKPRQLVSVAATAIQEPEPGPLLLLSRKPLLLLQHHFLTRKECKQLIAMTLRRQAGARFEKKLRGPLAPGDGWPADEDALLRRIEERLARLTGGPVHNDETALVGTLTPPGGGGDVAEHLGFHVDTNAAHWRFCTAIVYLSTVDEGGETIFPAAVGAEESVPSEEVESAAAAGGKLLDLGLEHTDRALLSKKEGAVSAAEQLLGAAGAGMRVRPQEGSVCIFWTRQDDGEIDRHSWHGGAPLPEGSDCKKWTLQKFKEVPLEVRNDSQRLAAFVKETRRQARRLVAAGGTE